MPSEQHHCHARGCKVPVKPELLMCLRHWSVVPRDLQRAVWSNYRRGQCDDKKPSAAWIAAARAAIDHVAGKEGLLPPPQATQGEFFPVVPMPDGGFSLTARGVACGPEVDDGG